MMHALIGIIIILFLIGLGIAKYHKVKDYEYPNNWYLLKDRYPLLSMIGSVDRRDPRVFEVIDDQLNDQAIMVISTYKIADEEKVVLECFAKYNRDGFIIDSHRVINIFDGITPDVYDAYYKAKESMQYLGIKRYFDEGVNK